MGKLRSRPSSKRSPKIIIYANWSLTLSSLSTSLALLRTIVGFIQSAYKLGISHLVVRSRQHPHSMYAHIALTGVYADNTVIRLREAATTGSCNRCMRGNKPNIQPSLVCVQPVIRGIGVGAFTQLTIQFEASGWDRFHGRSLAELQRIVGQRR